MKVTLGVACDAGSSLANKTGGWRTFRPVFDYDKCVRCGTCQLLCPDMCVHEDKATANDKGKCLYTIDMDYCKGCAICANECAKGAITMILEAK